jgi:hypothetical protein
MNVSQLSTRVYLLIILITSLTAAAPIHAQLVGGSIAGEVVDPSNAAIDQAKVLIRNAETGNERSIVTGNEGTFTAPSIPVGVYTVFVERDGFAPLQRTGIALEVGQSVHLHLTLVLGTVGQTVRAWTLQRCNRRAWWTNIR